MTSQYGNNIDSTTSGTAGSSGVVGPSGGVRDNSKSTSGLSGIKSAIAGVHGLGEKVRGEFNAGVDRTFDEVVCFYFVLLCFIWPLFPLRF